MHRSIQDRVGEFWTSRAHRTGVKNRRQLPLIWASNVSQLSSSLTHRRVYRFWFATVPINPCQVIPTTLSLLPQRHTVHK